MKLIRHKKGLKSYLVWLCLGAVILFAAAVRIRLLSMPLERDEGEYAYAGQVLLQGHWPYQLPSLYKYKMPGTYFIYALILAVFGQTISGIHAGLLVANISTIILLFFIARHFFDDFAAVIAAAVYAILSMGEGVLGIPAHSEHFVVLAVVGGLLLLLKSISDYKWWKLFLSGLLFGAAFIIRQHGAAFIPFAFIYLLFSLIRLYKKDWRLIISRLVLFCLATAIPFIATCFFLWIVGVFDNFWFWNFVYSRKYLAMLPITVGIYYFYHASREIVMPSVTISLLAAVGLIGLFFNRKFRPHIVFMGLYFIFSFASICPGLYFRGHYFIHLLPAVSLFAAAGAICIKDVFKCYFITKVLAVIIVSAGLIYPVFIQRDLFFVLSPVKACRSIYRGNPFPESVQIAEYIEQNSKQEDTVAILGSEPQILFYAKRHSATAYTDTYELMKKHDFALDMQKEMISEIESSSPEFIVFVNINASWLCRPESHRAIFDWYQMYIAQYYQEVGIIDLVTPDLTIYRWDEDVINYKPISQNNIFIFRKKH